MIYREDSGNSQKIFLWLYRYNNVDELNVRNLFYYGTYVNRAPLNALLYYCSRYGRMKKSPLHSAYSRGRMNKSMRHHDVFFFFFWQVQCMCMRDRLAAESPGQTALQWRAQTRPTPCPSWHYIVYSTLCKRAARAHMRNTDLGGLSALLFFALVASRGRALRKQQYLLFTIHEGQYLSLYAICWVWNEEYWAYQSSMLHFSALTKWLLCPYFLWDKIASPA